MQMMLHGRCGSYLHFPLSRLPTPKVPGLRLIGWEKGQRGGENAECNHSSTSEQRCDHSALCKPSGREIIVWTQRRPLWCQGALQHSHCQFMNTRFVSVHIKTWASNSLPDPTAAISHQPPLSYNLFFYILLAQGMLMAPNWPHHYGHIKFKLAPNYIEIIF